ncbi:transcriptional repressor LexA [Fictibacillus gelatini]|uniref:transcriptional repressor LexA n=1 Tax=Fictibacillus gelatini TaxID=225985 RepID=UPI000408B441|nr:transcriptional repressor LexA [Fictibacillus gelatini]
MSLLGERLKKARENKKLSQMDVSNITNINNKTLSRYEKGGTEPDIKTLKILADLYNVTTDYLTGRIDDPHLSVTDIMDGLPKDLRERLESSIYLDKIDFNQTFINSMLTNVIMTLFEFLTELNNLIEKKPDNLINEIIFEATVSDVTEILRDPNTYFDIKTMEESLFKDNNLRFKLFLINSLDKYINENIKMLKTDIGKEEQFKTIRLPVLGYIAAGQPILANEHIEEWTEIPNLWNLKEGQVFILRVKGDSMIGSRIYDGDRVVVKIQPDVENGEIAVVNVNGDEATLKRVKKTPTGQVILYPDNPNYEPILINNEKARIIGKVIQVMFEPS